MGVLRRDVGWNVTTVTTALRYTSGARTFALLRAVVAGTDPASTLGVVAKRAMRYADRYFSDSDCVERCIQIIQEANDKTCGRPEVMP